MEQFLKQVKQSNKSTEHVLSVRMEDCTSKEAKFVSQDTAYLKQ